MANITLRKDGLNFTAPAETTYSYGRYSSSGYANFATFKQEWTGINLGYTTGYVFPTSGLLTSVTVRALNGDLIYSGDSFSYNLINEPLGSGPDILFFKISKITANKISGTIEDDNLVVFLNNDYLDGSLGSDTLILFSNFSEFTFTNLSSAKSSASAKTFGYSFSFNSIENVKFLDKTVKFSELVAPNFTFSANQASVNEGGVAYFTIDAPYASNSLSGF